MSEPDAPPRDRPRKSSIFRRPAEYAMIAAVVIAAALIANKLEVLPDDLEVMGQKFTFDRSDAAALQANTQEIADIKTDVDQIKAQLSDVVEAFEALDPDALGFDAGNVMEQPTPQGAVTKELLAADAAITGEGVVWLGSYDPVRGWLESSVILPATTRTLPAPDALEGHELQVKLELNVRERLPGNDAEYFRAVPVLGVAEPGAKVRIVGEPVRYARTNGEQYWTRAEIEYVPVKNLPEEELSE